jgi:glyceraldehyde 3-phosphate dehydrogenase
VPVVDRTVETERPTSAGEVNDIFAGRADRDELEGIFAYSEDPIVSSDIVGSPYSAIFDAGFTSVIDETFVKVLAWYDNEWGYGTRLSELAERVSAPVPASA